MKFVIEESSCIGCGACPMIAPEVFSMNDDGLAYVIMPTVTEEFESSALDALESCPTDAISNN